MWVDRGSVRRRMGCELLSNCGFTRQRGANRRQDAQLQDDLACSWRRRLLPRPCLRRRLTLGLGDLWGHHPDREHPHGNRSANRCATDDPSRDRSDRTCVVGRVRRPMDQQLRRRQRHATARNNWRHEDCRRRRDQSRLRGSRRRLRVGRGLVSPLGGAPPWDRTSPTAFDHTSAAELRFRRCLEHRGRCGRHLGDDTARRRAVAYRPEDKHRHAREFSVSADGSHR